MREGKILMLDRRDLNKVASKKTIEEISHLDFVATSMQVFFEAAFILFVDDDGRMKILKNRHGKDGIVF
jgi:hypothetical protein